MLQVHPYLFNVRLEHWQALRRTALLEELTVRGLLERVLDRFLLDPGLYNEVFPRASGQLAQGVRGAGSLGNS